jgi:hypothetical protein
MSYLGNVPELTNYVIATDKFSGTGACTQFTLARNISDANALSVVVNGVLQTPIQSYTVSNGLLTFDEAPSAGSTNITVNYLASSVITYANLGPGQITAGAVTSTSLADDAVTSPKILAGAVIGGKIATGAITGNIIGLAAISGNNIGATAINANNIVPLTITGNLIANNAVSGNNIVSPPDIFDDAFLLGGM